MIIHDCRPALIDHRSRPASDWWSMSTFSVLNRWSSKYLDEKRQACSVLQQFARHDPAWLRGDWTTHVRLLASRVTRYDALGLGRQKVVVMSLTLMAAAGILEHFISQFNRSANTYMLHTACNMSMEIVCPGVFLARGEVSQNDAKHPVFLLT